MVLLGCKAKLFDSIHLEISFSSDAVDYSTSEYEYRKKLRVRVQVLILKNVLEYEYRKKV